jgi:hypothetical protein
VRPDQNADRLSPEEQLLFDARFPRVSGAAIGRAGAAGILATGGYPELLRRSLRGRGIAGAMLESFVAMDTESRRLGLERLAGKPQLEALD